MENKTSFDEWMRKIKNIYYYDNEQMCNAYERIKKWKKDIKLIQQLEADYS